METMKNEFNALLKNGKWNLVPRRPVRTWLTINTFLKLNEILMVVISQKQLRNWCSSLLEVVGYDTYIERRKLWF
jgi:hypothetical protein